MIAKKHRLKLKPKSWLYVETSALVAALVEADAAALGAMRSRGNLITSALTITEARRAILRAQLSARITTKQRQAALRSLTAFRRRCHIVSVTDAILNLAAGAFPVEPIRTLDAIHLATIQELGEPAERMTVVTRDHRVRDNAIAFGYAVA
jgi:predicted nucleic acid-binding protein